LTSGFAEGDGENLIEVSQLSLRESRPFTVDGAAFLPFLARFPTTEEEEEEEHSMNTDSATKTESHQLPNEVAIRSQKRSRLDSDVDSRQRKIQLIEIRESDFTTYRAMLAYLYTGSIPFTALPSDYLVSRDKAEAERLVSDPEFVFETPETWLFDKFANLEEQRDWQGVGPCSPHSMFRLADCYSITKLKELAKARILRCLTIENIAYELFSPLSIDYEEIQKPVLEFFVKYWDEVKKTTAFRNVLDKMVAGDLSNARELVEKVWTMTRS
ncbi:hypothetical protein JCM3765_005997, partial [Sporobolomyces pararoseus]